MRRWVVRIGLSLQRKPRRGSLTRQPKLVPPFKDASHSSCGTTKRGCWIGHVFCADSWLMNGYPKSDDFGYSKMTPSHSTTHWRGVEGTMTSRHSGLVQTTPLTCRRSVFAASQRCQELPSAIPIEFDSLRDASESDP